MDIKNQIIELAKKELGYSETKTNITKYAKYFDSIAWQWFNTKKQGAEWCAIFICWLFCQILGPEKARSFLNCPAPKNNCAAGVKYFYSYIKRWKVSEGAPGDIIFFGSDNPTHVGLIEKIDNKGLYITIEGNKSNKVGNGSYAKKSKKIYAICRPDWSKLENNEPVPAIEKPTTNKPNVYIVKKGDTMSGIAKKLGVSLNYLIKKNPNIKNINLIYPSQHINY